jgi:hypothetical protein
MYWMIMAPIRAYTKTSVRTAGSSCNSNRLLSKCEAVTFVFAYYGSHNHLHELGHVWSVLSSWRVHWSLQLDCWRPMGCMSSVRSFVRSFLPSFLPSFQPSFLPSLRRYSSGWALASWIISLHFFICSGDEASNGKIKKWEECGWKRSWPTYLRWFFIHPIQPRLIIWFLNNLVFTVWGC